jgi:hypothetical protein
MAKGVEPTHARGDAAVFAHGTFAALVKDRGAGSLLTLVGRTTDGVEATFTEAAVALDRETFLRTNERADEAEGTGESERRHQGDGSQ